MAKFLKVIRFFSNKLFYKHFFHNVFTVRKLSETPIIVCGCPRSGTTLLISILDSHPEIHVIPFETAVLNHRPASRRVFRNEKLHFAFSKFQIFAYLFSTKIKSTANRWCEKTPFNIFNIEEIIKMYNGNVKFINIIRDGRDVVSSSHKKLGYIATPKLWANSIREAKKYEHFNNFISLRYESLIADAQTELNKVSEFLNLQIEFDLVNWTERSAINVDMKKSIVHGREMPFEVQRIKHSSVGNWKNSKSPHISEFLNSTEIMELNKALGYN